MRKVKRVTISVAVFVAIIGLLFVYKTLTAVPADVSPNGHAVSQEFLEHSKEIYRREQGLELK